MHPFCSYTQSPEVPCGHWTAQTQSDTGSTLTITQNHAHTPLHPESTPCKLWPRPRAGLHCRAGLIQSGVQNGQNGFEDGWCTPYAATGVHPGLHADTGQSCISLNQAAHSKKHKTTHTHCSTLSRHRTRFGPGRRRVCIAVRADPKLRAKRAKRI